MRVLHIWKTDYFGGGGGAIAMHRLHSGLRKAGVDSKILSANKTTESPYVSTMLRRRRLEAWLQKVTSRLGLNDIHCVSSYKIVHNPVYMDADVLHIHGLHSSFFSYLALPRLTKRKAAVFTLHDMWPLTGHCAINYDCERWKIGCGHCPYLDAYPPVRRDGTRIEWRLKNWVYGRSNLTIVSPSVSYAERARVSMLNRFPIHLIPHGIDTEAFQPLDRNQCRSLLGIEPGRKVLMFAALSLSQFNKGGDLLLKALAELPEALKAETTMLLLGRGGETISETVKMQALDLGHITNDRIKAIAYSAADVFISPTRAEAFGLVCLESIACGTPVVSFGVGGVPDIIRHGVTGYLAQPENVSELRSGIIELLDDERKRNYMGQQGRALAQKEYSIELQIQRHIELYEKLSGG